MAIEAEALRALSEKASQGEWSLGKAEGGYRFLDAAGIPSKPGPDRNVKWSGFARFVVEMEDDVTCSGRSNLEFVAALVNAYRSGSLIHRSALAEDTARAAEDGRWHVTARDGKPRYDGEGERWLQTWSEASATYDIACIDGDWSCGQEVDLLGMDAWRWLAPWPDVLAPALPLTKGAADANR